MYRVDTSGGYVASSYRAINRMPQGAGYERQKGRNLGDMWSQWSVLPAGSAGRAARRPLPPARTAKPATRAGGAAGARPPGRDLQVGARARPRRRDGGAWDVTNLTRRHGGGTGRAGARVKAASDLPVMTREYGEFRVYGVDVCHGGAWNRPAPPPADTGSLAGPVPPGGT
jgi:hypothetical protein